MKKFVFGSGDYAKGLMKGGKDEEKQTGPLFPRLHISNADAGGAKAPPRNKMALSEQLSLLPQRFTSGAASMSPLPSNIDSVPLTFSSQDGGHPYSSGGASLNMLSLQWRSMEPTNQTAKPVGTLKATADCDFFQPHNIFDNRNSPLKKLGDDNDIVQTFAQSWKTSHSNTDQKNMKKDKLNFSSPVSSAKLQTVVGRHLKHSGINDLKSRQDMRNQAQEITKLSETRKDCAEKQASMMSREKTLADTASSPIARSRTSEPVNHAIASLNLKKNGNLVEYISRLHEPILKPRQECRVLQESKAFTYGALGEPEKPSKKRSASTMEDVSSSTPENNHRDPEKLGTVGEDQDCKSSIAREVERNGDSSDTSVVESLTSSYLSPDYVAGLLGQRQFWNVRRTILHQQRVFTLQLYELHRLIKVQRLIAGSPELIFEDSTYLHKSSIGESPAKKDPSHNVLKLPPLTVEQICDSEKPKLMNDCVAESAERKLHLPSLRNNAEKGATWQSDCKPDSAIPPPASTAADANVAPWFLHPAPGNQWLVPVRLPSEGLVYKPYTGPCPPAGGLKAPPYGACGLMSLTPVGVDFSTPAYGVPASHQQGIRIFSGTPQCQTYFPPYGMSVTNQYVFNSAAKQVIPFARSRVNQGNQLSKSNTDSIIPHQSSSNVLIRKCGLDAGYVRNSRASKASVLQGSSASSPAERAQGDALPLFPTSPVVQASDKPAQADNSEQRIQVIKAVPHNPMTASESAARIFQSIQQERKQHD